MRVIESLNLCWMVFLKHERKHLNTGHVFHPFNKVSFNIYIQYIQKNNNFWNSKYMCVKAVIYSYICFMCYINSF